MSSFNDQDVFEKEQVEAEFLLIPAPNSQYQYIYISLQMCIRQQNTCNSCKLNSNYTVFGPFIFYVIK